MYLRTTKRKRTDGSEVRYLQLAHNRWDADAGHSVVEVLYSFGREDQLDRDAITRLISSLSRALPPGEALAAGADAAMTFVGSRPMGTAYVLDGLWRRLGIDKTMRSLVKGRKLDARVERVLFALVANRAIDPSSKLAATSWVRDRVHVGGLDDLDPDSCYRAMDWLLEVEADLARRCTGRPPTSSTWRSTCCSSTPPRPTSRPRPRMIRLRVRRSGSAPTASPRTTGRTCRRW